MTPTRRQVIAGGAVGVTALASGVLIPAVARAATPAASARRAGAGTAGTAGIADTTDVVVAHVRDVSAGHIDIYVGQRQVRITDRDVAARLSRAAH